MLGACGIPTQAPGSGSPVVSPTTQQTGYLEGQARIGPLQPVERIGVPSPTAPPGACTSRGLLIYAVASGAAARRVGFVEDCSYRIALAPGAYRVELEPHGIDRTPDLPTVVQIQSGATTRLDVSIDTGIR